MSTWDQLIPALDALISTKKTARKEGLSKLLELLASDVIKNTLDQNTLNAQTGDQGKITWKYLIDQVIASINLEIDAQLKESKRKPAPIKIEVATALKSVLKLADGRSGGPQLYSCIRAVFIHIEYVLGLANEPALAIFLPEYSKLLCDDLLSSSYFHLIGRKTFKGLISIYSELLLKFREIKPKDYDPYARVLFFLMTRYPYDLKYGNEDLFSKLTTFLQSLFKERGFFDQSRANTILSLLSTLNFLIRQEGLNASAQIRELGNNLSSLFLSCYNNRAYGEQLKEQIVEFFRVQLRVCNSFTGEFEAPPYLPSLYEAISEALKEKGKSLRVSTTRPAKKEEKLSERGFIDLAADVFYFMDVHLRAEKEGEQPKKKMKFSDVWVPLFEALSEATPNTQWLQVLHTLAKKRGAFFEASRLQDLIQSLAKILEKNQERWEEIDGWCLKCLISFAGSSNAKNSELLVGSQQQVWEGVWNVLLKKISYRNVPQIDLLLSAMASVMENKLVDSTIITGSSSQQVIWKLPLFEEESTRCSRGAVRFWRTFLRLFDIPEVESEEVGLRREKLLAWLVSSLGQGWESIDVAHYLSEKTPSMPPSPQAMAEILVALVKGTKPSNTQFKFPSPDTLFLPQEMHHVEEKLRQILESQLLEIEESRTLYPVKKEKRGSEVKGSVGQQLLVHIRTHLQLTLARLLKTRCNLLIREGDVLQATKKRTTGIDKTQLSSTLVLLIYHCQVIVVLLSLTGPVAGELNAILSKTLDKIVSCFVEKLEQWRGEFNKLHQFLLHLQLFFPYWCQHHPNSMLPLLTFLTKFVKQNAPTDDSRKHYRYFASATGGYCRVQDASDDLDFEEEDLLHSSTSSTSSSSHLGSRASLDDCVCMIIKLLAALASSQVLVNTPSAFWDALTTVQVSVVGLLPKVIAPELKFEIITFLLSLPDRVTFVLPTLLQLREIVRCIPELSADTKMKCRVLSTMGSIADICRNKSSSMEITKELEVCFEILSLFIKVRSCGKLDRVTRKEFVQCLSEFVQIDWPDSEEQFPPLAEEFMGFINDPDFRIRSYIARAITILFEQFSAQTEVYQDVASELAKAEKNMVVEFKVTALLTFGEIACISQENERFVVFKLCKTAVESDESKRLVALILQHIARHLGYPSVKSYVKDLLPLLFLEWMESKDPPLYLQNFPYHLLESESFEDFLREHCPLLVSVLVLETDRKNLEDVAKVLNVDIVGLVKNHFGIVFATTFPLYYTSKKGLGVKICEQFLKDIIDTKKDIIQNLDTILIELFNRIAFGTQPTSPYFSEEAITKVLHHLAKSFSKDSIATLLLKPPDKLQKIMLHFQENLIRSHRMAEKRRIIDVYDLIINRYLEVRITEQPIILRDFIHVLLHQTSSQKELIEEICKVLLKTCQNVLRGDCSELRRHLNLIVSTLIPFAPTCEKALEVLRFLIVLSRDVLGPEIRMLDPFPNDPIFFDIGNVYQQLRGKYGLMDEMQRFLLNGQKQGIIQFKEQLKARRKELYDILRKSEQRGETQTVISQLIWKLVRYCSSPFDDARVDAAECLGEIGLWGHTALSFSSRELSSRKNIKVQVIELLVSYLTDPDVDVVKTASACLKDVLRTPVAQEVVSQMEGMTAYLSPYTGRPRKGVPQTSSVGISDIVAWQVEGKSSSEWIMNQSAWLSEKVNDEILSLCAEMCKAKSQFAEKVYPYLVYQSLQADTVGNFAMSLAKNFRKHLLSSRNNDKEKLRLTLDVLNFIRRQTTLDARSSVDAHPSARRSMDRKPVIETHFFGYLDFFEIAKAAFRCDAPLTSLVYLEMWCERAFGELRMPTPGDTDHRSIGVNDFQALLLDIFSNIDEPDSIYGIAFSGDINCQLRTYEHEGAWYKTLTRYDALLYESQKGVGTSPLSTSSAQGLPHMFSQQYRQGILSSLQNLGLNNLLGFYLRGVATDMPDQFVQLSEFQYQVAWQSCRWDIEKNYSQLLDPSAEKEGVIGFHAGIYRCLQALHSGDQLVFHNTLTKLYKSLATDVAVTTTSESLKPFYPLLAKLDFLNDLSESWNLHPTSTSSSSTAASSASLVASQSHVTNDRLKEALEGWSYKEEALAKKCSFELLEPSLSLRGVVLSLVGQKRDVVNHLQSLASIARRQQRFEIASNAIFQIKSVSQQDDFEWRLDEAKTLWAQGEHDKAIRYSRVLISELEAKKSRNDKLLSLALLHTGRWLAQTRSESTQIIREDFLMRSLGKLRELGEVPYKAFFILGNFLAGVYSNLIAHQKSAEWETSQRLRKHREVELQQCKELYKTTPAEKRGVTDKKKDPLLRHINQLQKLCNMDEQESIRMENEKQVFLLEAVENYCSCLVYGEKYDLKSVFSVSSLWFSNPSDPLVNKLMRSHISRIPSFKFVVLIYQIASRISNLGQNEDFQEVLHQLIVKVATDHPHHTLWQLFSLRNGDKVTKKPNLTKISSDKIAAATSILKEIRDKTKHKQLILQLEKLMSAYINLAFLSVVEHQGSTNPIPLGKAQLATLPPMNLVPVPTINIPIDPTGTYADLITIAGFESHFRLVGGVNLPKNIECRGSDGKKYRQLVKGNDDLRQDAVMQQLFGLVSVLLKKDRDTSKRNMNVRTYKVIPLSPEAGLLEWVENTMPLAEYLIGTPPNKNSAHVRLRPKDKTSPECRVMMNNATTEAQKRNTYREITTKLFKPVFHHFFLEYFPDPADWFEKRLNYTRSVASNSIVGYIVGLGDRHSSNILIDKTSAEVVHIDLGVAFEQGKSLPTPEIVPFRLTRDIVDGMGITGVEGVFRRCCEETMKVLRVNHSLILTIVEVLIHDPLYKWTLSPLKALRLQSAEDRTEMGLTNVEETEEGNKNAERAILKVKQKLQGYEYGEPLSVQGQVTQLINEATDPERLCKMYVGWAPWV